MKINADNRAEWIEKYLDKELDLNELSFFQKTLETDAELKDELREQESIHRFIRTSLKEEVYRNQIKDIIAQRPELISGGRDSSGFFFRTVFISAAAILLVFVIFWYWELIIPPPENIGNNHQPNDTTKIPGPPKEDQIQNQDTVEKNQNDPQEKNEPRQGIQNNDPVFALIPERIFQQRRGFAGTSNSQTRQRPVLIYSKKPANLTVLPNQNYYFFGQSDTIRFYGNIRPDQLQLNFFRKDAEYLLISNQDTFEISKDTEWQILQNNPTNR